MTVRCTIFKFSLRKLKDNAMETGHWTVIRRLLWFAQGLFSRYRSNDTFSFKIRENFECLLEVTDFGAKFRKQSRPHHPEREFFWRLVHKSRFDLWTSWTLFSSKWEELLKIMSHEIAIFASAMNVSNWYLFQQILVPIDAVTQWHNNEQTIYFAELANIESSPVFGTFLV